MEKPHYPYIISPIPNGEQERITKDLAKQSCARDFLSRLKVGTAK